MEGKMNETVNVDGVREIFGQEARTLRRILRSMEDILDERGFDQLDPGILVSDSLFRQNLDFLGERFLENLSYVQLNGEGDNVVILPEGTMRVYDFIRKNDFDKAKIFYSSQFVRNENPEEVRLGKTRNFWQIGFEIFNHDKNESTLEAIETAYEMIRAVDLVDAYVRLTDKRLMKGFYERFPEEEQSLIFSIIDKADDSGEEFKKLYDLKGGKDLRIRDEVAGFMDLIKSGTMTLDDLRKYGCGSRTYSQGIENLERIQETINPNVNLRIIPFMSKSWDACDEMMFDIRYPSYEGAICGGGNLTYNNFKPDSPKSGAGIGVTRVHEIIQKGIK